MWLDWLFVFWDVPPGPSPPAHCPHPWTPIFINTLKELDATGMFFCDVQDDALCVATILIPYSIINFSFIILWRRHSEGNCQLINYSNWMIMKRNYRVSTWLEWLLPPRSGRVTYSVKLKTSVCLCVRPHHISSYIQFKILYWDSNVGFWSWVSTPPTQTTKRASPTFSLAILHSVQIN